MAKRGISMRAMAAELEKQVLPGYGDPTFGWFTHVRVDGKEVAIARVGNFKASLEKGQVRFRFTLYLPQPLDPIKHRIEAGLYDPTFFDDLGLSEKDPITLTGITPGECSDTILPDPAHKIYFNQVTPEVIRFTCKSILMMRYNYSSPRGQGDCIFLSRGERQVFLSPLWDLEKLVRGFLLKDTPEIPSPCFANAYRHKLRNPLPAGRGESYCLASFKGSCSTHGERKMSLTDLLHYGIELQRSFNRDLAHHLRAAKDGSDPMALWLAMGLAFAYGVFHALGPGHGKFVVVTYFLAHQRRVARGFLMGTQIAVMHVLSAIVIVLIAHYLAVHIWGPTGDMPGLRTASYACIALAGAYMMWRALRHHDHGDDCGHNHGDDGKQGLLSFTVGIAPCSGRGAAADLCLCQRRRAAGHLDGRGHCAGHGDHHDRTGIAQHPGAAFCNAKIGATQKRHNGEANPHH